ncbi:FG-GAP repeat domain-containing protein [Streptomyces sp. NBC_00385]|uniref:FG-GAP repeat domain-containing protein n=1 Tax=Streptomyces sp. NBC_00385 TaxID=2975733 RepID=UPI002DD949CC|nr:VCBS repeat-containing protein [Streptomyces sp. NBC_00385]WRZ05105.1 VCBS repeat-containing protein [Streptomyces sp. NBC_00385]
MSVPLTDGTSIQSVLDVRTARNGAVVALWNRLPSDRSKRELVVSVRPAGSVVWGAPHVLTTTGYERGNADLVVGADGSVTASWVEYPNDVPPYEDRPGAAFRMSVLAAGASTWSAPADIVTDPSNIQGGKLAGSPTGRLVAVWRHNSDRSSELYASVREAPGQPWSQPARLDEQPVGGESVSDPELVYSDRGTATVAFTQYSGNRSEIKVVDRVGEGPGWSEPATVSDPKVHAATATLTLGQDGRAALLWSAWETSEGDRTQMFAGRPAGSTAWTAGEPVTGFDTGGWRKAVVGPEGDVTVLGVVYTEASSFHALTTTRSAATGNWSAVKTLSTGYTAEDQFDLATGPDGSVHAVWTQGATSRGLMTSSRVNGAWSAAPTPLSTGDYAIGQITVGSDNRPVAVWTQATGDYTSQVRTATTAPVPAASTPKWRDFSGDGKGDLLALTSGGGLTVRTGTGTGDLRTGASATGWPATSTVVPFGDLSADGCNDVLVRNATGVLTRHDGSCGKAFAPNGPRLTIGSGWQIYNALSAPGDLTGDGRTDLVARTPAGELWRYADDGKGKLTARGKIGNGWKIYDTLVGAGDLNGDKHGDLLARDTAGVLWRYNGTGKGAFAGRTKIGGGWQVYNSLASVGDITGDGKADLVARDTAGVLWRYNGTGKGAFAARARIGGGWQMYKTLS